MTNLNLATTVGQWVARHPETSRVFESWKIDYCCGGGKSLEEACWELKLDPQRVLAQLDELGEPESTIPIADWNVKPLADLCDHIEQTHHAYLRTALPRLTELVAKVVKAHGEKHAELAEVQQALAGLRAELEPHMMKEEMVLFPAIRLLESAAEPPRFPFGAVANPIRVMEQEHEHAGGDLARIRELTGEYRVPAEACNTYQVMLEGLRELELNMHVHVHKENSILFPRAIELERARSTVQPT